MNHFIAILTKQQASRALAMANLPLLAISPQTDYIGKQRVGSLTYRYPGEGYGSRAFKVVTGGANFGYDHIALECVQKFGAVVVVHVGSDRSFLWYGPAGAKWAQIFRGGR